MLNESFVELLRSAFGFEPVCRGSEPTCIFKDGQKICVKYQGRIVAEFEDDERDYGAILHYYAQKTGLITPLDKRVEELLRGLFVNIIVLTEVEDRNGFSHSQRVAKIAEALRSILDWPRPSVKKFETMRCCMMWARLRSSN